MERTLQIGIIGDYNPDSRHHLATEEALRHAAARLSITVAATWLATPSLADGVGVDKLEGFSGFWCSPGSPYRSLAGALAGIRFAREAGRPFIGT